jgi:hypothetical protein
MKKVLIISIILFTTLCSSAQLSRHRRPYRNPHTRTSYLVSINEFNFGAGMQSQEIPYSKYFVGATSLIGYRFNETITAGAGTGLLIYNDGLLIPVSADIRINLSGDVVIPYLSASGGILLNPSDFNEGIRTFINPSAGLAFPARRNISITAGAGAFIQMKPNTTTVTFVNLKGGITYKF